jgi:hypothetical protein
MAIDVQYDRSTQDIHPVVLFQRVCERQQVIMQLRQKDSFTVVEKKMETEVLVQANDLFQGWRKAVMSFNSARDYQF